MSSQCINGHAHSNIPARTCLWQYSYVQLGCSKGAEQTMLAYAKTLVGKPFSNSGMARSIVYPRQTTGDSFFCAELVAAVQLFSSVMLLFWYVLRLFMSRD